jgi:putative ABC transport system permease protein
MKVRFTATMVAVLGIAGVVAVFLAMLAMARGFSETLKSSGSEGNAIVLRGGATSEMQSAVTLEQIKVIGDAQGVARDGAGGAIISPEVVVNATLPRASTGDETACLIRGVSAKAFDVRSTIKMLQGRRFTPGLNEVIVGRYAAELYNAKVGGTLSFNDQQWAVVGIFDAGGSSFDSEVWIDAVLLNQAYKRPANIFQSVTVKLESPAAFTALQEGLTADPRMTIAVEREITYYENQSKLVTKFIRVIGSLIAFIMAIGAVFAALNTMYAAVSARSSEIATMRALGFAGSNIVVSFLCESLTIALFGAVLGSLLIIPLNGFTASTTNMSTFSHLVFAFRITPDLMAQGLAFALIMGFFGGLFPALHAARQPIAATLRGM